MSIDYKVVNGEVSTLHDHLCEQCGDVFIQDCQDACEDKDEFCEVCAPDMDDDEEELLEEKLDEEENEEDEEDS